MHGLASGIQGQKNAQCLFIATKTKIEVANRIVCDLGSSEKSQAHGSIAQPLGFQEPGATRDSPGLAAIAPG